MHCKCVEKSIEQKVRSDEVIKNTQQSNISMRRQCFDKTHLIYSNRIENSPSFSETNYPRFLVPSSRVYQPSPKLHSIVDAGRQVRTTHISPSKSNTNIWRSMAWHGMTLKEIDIISNIALHVVVGIQRLLVNFNFNLLIFTYLLALLEALT